MDSEYIEQLLQRYWQCETSLEEEARLRDYFANTPDLPARLLRYKDWFLYQQAEQEVCPGDDFDARLLAKIEETPVVKARRLTPVARLMPLMRAAAVVAVVLSLGNLMQHSFFVDDGASSALTDTIGEQISAPSVAFSEEVATKYEQHLLDSLCRTGHRVEPAGEQDTHIETNQLQK